MTRFYRLIMLLIISAIVIPITLSAQGVSERAVRVYLDRFPSRDFLKTEVSFVDYVRDPKQAEVFALYTRQYTGGGGKEHTLTFTGQEHFAGVNDTLTVVTAHDATSLEEREGVAEKLRLGLIRYAAHSKHADRLSVKFDNNGKEQEQEVQKDDKWDFWYFSVSASIWMRGEESYNNKDIDMDIDAERVTENWKTEFSLYSNYDESEYSIDDGKILSIERTQRFRGLLVKSLTDHWSAGVRFSAKSQTRYNTDLGLEFMPGIEYNIFPYKESTRRRFSFLYTIGPKHNRYIEETIFDKIEETMFMNSLSVNGRIYERWGNVFSELTGSLYFHDTEINKIDWYNSFRIRIIKGLSLRLSGEVSLIHDQIYLPKEGRTVEEILLRRTQLKTDWDYWFSVGFSYSFGSIYNNVVNPRFNH